ncbi:thioesterase family protein [Nesterenkonia ebinurensis]|uniref:thioesterase family protein n=1 Tax=Nesterenkonia ebinurensis TaxID=2608252 RepID=UPI00123DF364|nr:thioesterase family protein [Nesterenkonia ebinurensis]
MHVIFRTLLILLKARRRPRTSPWEAAEITLRALPTDVDILMHINNGQYFSLFDLGRYDMMARSGLWEGAKKRGWHPVVQAEQITFRKSVNFWTKFQIYTKLIGVDERCFYIEHRVVVDGEIYVRGYVAGRLIGANGPVTIPEILEMAAESGHPAPEDLEVSEDLKAWRRDFALPASRKPAPHLNF